jgi:hypothetical protein
MANRRVVFISRLRDNAEQELLEELKRHFPSDAMAGIGGIEDVTICQGNGLFAAIIEYNGDFEEIYSKYLANPAVRAFHTKLAAYLKDVPTTDKPAELPLVGDVLYWDGRKVKEAVG